MSTTSNSTQADVMANDAPLHLLSLPALRTVHSYLLKLRREHGESPQLLAIADAFIRQGRAIGTLVDAEDDRWASQSLLDYWATVLDRAGLEPSDATLSEFDPALAPELDDSLCPYLGLDAFREADHNIFFGRQRLVEEMISQLMGSRLLAVVGPSGSGKSSVVRAGLLPVLKTGAVPASQGWLYAPPMVPGSNPLANLARLLRPADESTGEWILRQVERFLQNTDRLTQLIGKFCPEPTVLIIDQFEEIFTLCNHDHTRQAFIDNLLGLIQAPGARHTVILTMRTDFEPHMARLPAFQPLFEEAQVRVPPLSAGELREAIKGPAELVGLKFEEGVVDTLIQDILGEPAALPLLQFTLLKLWEIRERNRITWEAYRRLGGARQALARSADEFYERLIPEEQVTAKRIVLRMVRPGEGLEVTSNRVRRETLYQASEARDRIDRVLDKLVRARLVRLTEGDTSGDAQVEVAHEALVRNWPRLVNWLEDERETMRRRLRLTAAAEQWEAVGRDPEALWRGPLLAEALRYQDLNVLETEFVQASQVAIEAERENEIARQRELARAQALAEAQQQQTQERAKAAKRLRRLAEEQARITERLRRLAEERARTAKRLRRLAVTLAVVFLLAVVAAVYGMIQQKRAQANEQIADTRAAEAGAAQATAIAERDRAEHQVRLSTSRALAAAAISNLDIDPECSILLAIQAVSSTYSIEGTVTREAEDALHRSIQTSRVQLTLFGHNAQVFGVAFSPDGTRLATASTDKTAKVWDAASGQELLTLSGHTQGILGIAFSPDGTRLATASDDNTAKVWDAASGQELQTLSGHIWGPLDITFSPDGTHLATASRDGTVKVWDAVSGQELLTLSGHTAEVFGVAYSPDGTRLATASRDKTAKVWDAVSGQELLTLSGHTNTVLGIAFYGTRLATASADSTVKVWDAVSGQELLTLSGHTKPVQNVAFSPDGTRLATASWDKTAKVWNISASQELLTLSGHTDKVQSVAFNPDGTRLVTASEDGTAKVWSTDSGQELLVLSGHTAVDLGAVFSPDGTRLATSGWNTAQVWDANSGWELHTLSGHDGWVWDIAFSPDGTRLVTASEDGTAKVWDVASGQELLRLSGHTGGIWSIAFSPDGTRLATAGGDGTAKVWDATSAKGLLTLFGHTERVFGVAFSPDGTRLATASEDGTAKVWDVATGRELLTLSGHTGTVWRVVFDPDGTMLATASFDKVTKVWNADTGQELLTLSGHTDQVGDIAFSPDGTRLATASHDGTVRVYALNIEELMTLACSRVTRNLTQSEWNTYFGRDVPYRRACQNLPVDRSVIEAVIERGREYAGQGQINEALAAVRQAVEFDPTLELDPETMVARMLVELGQQYAYQGAYGDALGALRQAVALDPSLELVPEAEVAMAKGRQYAYQGAYDDALASLRQAVELDPQIELRHAWDLANAYDELCRQRGSPDLTEMALSACERAVELAIATDNAYLNHEICRNAGIDGLAETFLPACERAVELAIATDNAYLNHEICQNADIDGLAETFLPACERAVELAIATDDTYLSYIICLNKSIDSLAGIVWPACEHAQGLAIEIPFRETVKGVVESGGRCVWIFEGTAGAVITIKMSEDGSMLDTHLTLLGPDGAVLITDDDGGDGSNSMVRGFVLPETGTYTIVARGSRDSAGAYELTLLDETE